jgi:hypothetical protein
MSSDFHARDRSQWQLTARRGDPEYHPYEMIPFA